MSNRSRLAPSLLSGLLPLIAGLVLLGFFARVFQPSAPPAPAADTREVDFSPVDAAVTPAAVRTEFERFLALGSRGIGQPGMRAAAQLVRKTYEEAGLEVLEHTVETVALVTEASEITTADGSPLPGVEVQPFMANHLQPMTTGRDGLTGTLVLLDEETIRTRRDFRGVIGVIDARPGGYDLRFGFDWIRYARLGLSALIVAHPDGLAALPWEALSDQNTGMVAAVPVNFVRLAATEGIFDALGREVRLRVLTRWEPVENTTFYGVLRAPRPAQEAIVISTAYDAPSILPALAPGGVAAANLALHLQTVRGLSAARDQLTRDVIFIAHGTSTMADDGLNHLARILQKNAKRAEENPLLRALGLPTRAGENLRVSHLQEHQRRNDQTAARVAEIRKWLEDPAFLRDPGATARGLDTMNDRTRAFFEEQFSYVVNETLLEEAEPVLGRRIDFLRTPERSLTGEPFRAYVQAKRAYDRLVSYAGYSPASFLRDAPAIADEFSIRTRFAARLLALAAYHDRRARQLTEEVAIARLFNGYSNFVALGTQLTPTPAPEPREAVTWLFSGAIGSSPSVAMHQLLRLVPAAPGLNVVEANRATRKLENHLGTAPFHALSTIDKWGYAVYHLINLDRQASYRRYGLPIIEPAVAELRGLDASFRAFGQAALMLAHGATELVASRVQEWIYWSYGGQVLVAGVGNSIVPSHPLAGAIIGNPSPHGDNLHSRPGYYSFPFIAADPYGRFKLEFHANDFPVFPRWYGQRAYDPVAASYDRDGLIRFMKDEGEDGQKLFRSANLDLNNRATRENTTIVTFRAAPMATFDLTNPQTLQDYTAIRTVLAEGLTPPRKRMSFRGFSLTTQFLEPQEFSYVLLQSGAAGNELVLTTRAFLLGIEDPFTFQTERDIAGPGYLTQDHPVLVPMSLEAARSMTWLNGHRLELQERFNMADEQTLDFQQKSADFLRAAEDAQLPAVERRGLARQAVTYATLNHPVIRNTVVEAVISIVWYLGLLVPFVFFFEKLVFGFADVRKQLAAQAAIFLVVFALLRILHPAFEMVRSSLMILLGFFIILISGGITLLFSGKFRENLEEIRKKQGKVDAAEVNKMGVLGSAFMLGLNNMHRRKVRTGLTCATLTLLTFVMISFTSTQNTVVEEDRPIGRAPYQGMLVKRDQFEPLRTAETFSLNEEFGGRYQVAERRFYLGSFDQTEGRGYNPDFRLTYRRAGETRSAPASSLLQLPAVEPLREGLEFTTPKRWFSSDRELLDERVPVILPDGLADELGISAAAVAEGPVDVEINGRPCRVIAIVTSQSIADLRDLDGRDLLPYNIEALSGITEDRATGTILAPDDSERIDADRIVITPNTPVFGAVPRARYVCASIAIVTPEASYREARELTENFMERTGQPLFYGLDGVAYRGKRTREASMAGFVDLIIPLVLAGLTVLNTMKGSVYERRDEIFVYNAVGIAPRYVFFMFMAEALVYAVVGCVLGYLLSQGVGRILTELGMTGGLNMTYASLSTIYASLTIMAAVFISTYFPARSAMEIAKPADDAGWKLPEPEEDTLAFDLPFNFDARQRMAVLAFFDRYLLDHSEGSSGRFFASRPSMGFVEEDGERVPQITSRVWLKPFDLAVSQSLQIQVPRDPETGQFKARIVMTRLTGTREAWTRLIKSYVGLIRRHFLHWRAVSPADREAMFAEARARFAEDLRTAPPSVPAQPASAAS